ncbi:carboxylesterase/lipase family protein [Streptomyces piniterrae]|uniref:Carboxylic ester hydrolase n=1 Tax=Streptomyces piniterrae TaxID=2571125 RepID=A0A4U0MXI1_9ACTN|nr:carboxylesterase family protein [Streptomyces piniterrae]TJZ41944.1 carboxylesterase/lipase family protein [Streptomyces piniterrae]
MAVNTDTVDVQVSEGLVRGRREGPGMSVAAFRGVPYAAPPLAERRFAVPLPPLGRREILRADGPVGTAPLQLPSAVGTLMNDPKPAETESCLTVNVWSPSLRQGPRPVLVWLPGGSFLTGGADLARYDGAELAAQEQIVVVLVNYRLGALGFLAPEWAEPARIEGSGTELTFRTPSEAGWTTNAGLLDQIAALRWIKKEIGAFGGDPDQIAVAGQSAGGQSLAALLALPQVRPLFRRALLHSAPLGMAPMPRAEAAETAEIFRKALGAEGAEDLRQATLGQLRRAQQHVLTRPRPAGDVRPPFRLVEDGPVVAPDTAQALRASPELAGTEIMLGTTRHECALWFARQSAPVSNAGRDGVTAEFARAFGSRADEALETYAAAVSPPYNALSTAFEEFKTDAFFAAPTHAFADILHRHGARTRMFRFDWQVPGRYSALRACHCVDIPFLLGREEARHAPLFADADQGGMQRLRHSVRRMWGAFVRTGSPSPTWAEHTPERPVVRAVGGEFAGTTLGSLVEPERRALWPASALISPQ